MKLLILDGNSVANRAFYGVHMLNAPDGTPSNAIHGFINILTRLLSDIKPDAVCTCFDLKEPTFRHKFAPSYKANRRPMPEDFAIQIPILKKVLYDMGIKNYELSGYEADDILGTVGQICENQSWDCYIATGDKDSFQLLTDRVKICYLSKDFEIYTPQLFFEKYGFKSANLVDYKAIAGDSSDNYSGVPGIGDKGATELISRYSTIDEVYCHLDELKKGTADKLIKGKESAYDSLFLATIFKFVPIDFNPEDNIWNYDFKQDLFQDLKKLGFYKLIDKWNLNKSVEASLSDYDSSIPEDIYITSDLKRDIELIPADKKPFDTTIAQYLINPLIKNYPSDVNYNSLINELNDNNLNNLYYNVELPLCSVLHKMEKKGFLVDRNALLNFGNDISSTIGIIQNDIYSLAGSEFNINSPKQLGEILFDKLCLPDKKKRSTNVEVLESLRSYHPIIDQILEYRTLSKLKGTYCEGLLKELDENNRIHTSLQQTVTATGRLSSTEPNLQNIPIRKEIGSQIRNMFVASPGNVLVDADYSQIELRLLAHIADDRAMIDAFNSGYDFHSVTASNVFGVPFDDVTPQLRSKAKAINFGIIYGMSAFSLAKDINSTTSEAKAYMDAYFAKYSNVEAYMKNIIDKAKTDGYVTSLYGRRRPLPELSSANYSIRQFGERVALNMPIQGTAADIIKMAMIEVDKRVNGMVLQVHDELIVECPENDAFEVSSILRESMENIAKLSVPLIVDVGIGKSWAEAH